MLSTIPPATIGNSVYILAKRTKGKKWEGVAIWQPDSGETCLAIAEYAFARAGYPIAQLPREGENGVKWAGHLRAAKNYRESAPLRLVSGTVEEVTAWNDLQRARHYIAQGWSLESQPEAQQAAKRAGLIA